MVAVLATSTSSDDGSPRPQIDERIDVGRERIWFGGDVEDAVERYVGVQGPHEEQCGGAGIEGAYLPGHHGPPEVIADKGQTPAGWAICGVGIERNDQLPMGAAVHIDGDVLGHHALDKGDELLGDGAENLAGIGCGGVDEGQIQEERRRRHDARLHGRAKESLLRLKVTENRCRGHADDRGYVRERGGIEPFLAEGPAGCLEQIITGYARWSSHL